MSPVLPAVEETTSTTTVEDTQPDGAEAPEPETVSTPAVTPSAKSKKKAKAKPVKKVTKKAPKAKKEKAPKVSKRQKPTIRERMFKLLASRDCTGPEIQTKLGLSGIPNILRDEGIMASPPRIRRLDIEGVRGVTYQLTAAGKKALEKGTIDSEAPKSAAGKKWPDEK